MGNIARILGKTTIGCAVFSFTAQPYYVVAHYFYKLAKFFATILRNCAQKLCVGDFEDLIRFKTRLTPNNRLLKIRVAEKQKRDDFRHP